MFCLCLILILSSVDIDYPEGMAAWPLGPSVTPRRGYGQWNDSDEFHRALDFHGSVNDPVFAPYSGMECYVLGVGETTDSIIADPVEGSALIGTGPFAVYGWHYAHIDVNPDNWEFIPEHLLDRDTVSALVPVPELGSHVHFSWLDVGAYAPGGPHPQHGYFNPIEYLGQLISFPYDSAAFGPTDGGEFNVFESIRGVVFAIEGNNCSPPLDDIRDVVDIIVRPYTCFYQNPANDSCTVRAVMWHLLRENCSTLEYYPCSILGSGRILFNFSGYIPDDNDPTHYYDEYRKIYFGGLEHWSNNICLTNTCFTPRSDSSFSGVATVWVDHYDRLRDYNDREFCRGGWDTRLSTEFNGDPAYTDEAATFTDGRYAIDVDAIPQRANTKTTVRLPVDDITAPEPEVTGVIVDNWAPRITNFILKDNPSESIFDRYYLIFEPNNPYGGRNLLSNSSGSWDYIGTGEGYNSYSLEIWYSEPVTNLTPNIELTIQMFTGPDSTVNWFSVLNFVLDPSCYNANGECEYAIYNASGEKPPGYVGNQIVELVIGSHFATDLAGHGLDADASTIAPAWSAGDSDNRETTFTYIHPNEPIQGYSRVVSDQDSRSHTLVGYYDYLSSTNEYIYHYITLPQSLWEADLFDEVNLNPSNCRCAYYGGVWMCDQIGKVLHAYIVDYQGNIVLDGIVYDFEETEVSGEVNGTCITTLQYNYPDPYNPTTDSDRYGWLGWRKVIPPPEDRINSEDTVYVEDIELYVTVYDAYNTSQNFPTVLIGTGNQWCDEQEKKWYGTRITSMFPTIPGGDGSVKVKFRKYIYPNTTPILGCVVLNPPVIETYSSLHSDSEFDTGIITQDIEIDDYFSVFPNPARGTVSIDFMTSEAAVSTVRIYDISGHLVNTIAEELPGMQNHNLLWNLKDASGNEVPVGIYYVLFVSSSFEETRTVIVIH